MYTVENNLRQRYPKIDEINRLIEWFDKETGEIVDGVYVENLPLEVIHKVYNCSPDDPVVDGFDITAKEAEILAHYVGIEFDFERYDYELDADYDYKRVGPWEGGAPFPVPSGN